MRNVKIAYFFSRKHSDNSTNWIENFNFLLETSFFFLQIQFFTFSRETDRWHSQIWLQLNHSRRFYEEIMKIVKDDVSDHENEGKPWFFMDGTYFPKPQKINSFSIKKRLRLFPVFSNKYEDNDRIVDQLMFVPHNYNEIQASGKLKKIFLPSGIGSWNIQPGRAEFLKSRCPVDTCTIEEDLKSADLVIFKDQFQPNIPLKSPKSPNQLYMLYYLESPMHTSNNFNVSSLINWMSTYRLLISPKMQD